jgi:3-hydroxybutyryl-CoA dehydrogenase
MAEAASVQTLGVVGAGQMGNGIAHVAALAGLDVKLLDAKTEAVAKAIAMIGKNMERQVAKGAITAEDRAGALARIQPANGYAAMAPCQLVIEAATEKEDIKKAIFKNLIAHVGPDCILATNTSSISVTRLGASTDRPAKFIGTHFFNPVPLMKLIEVIRGIATDDATYATVAALAKRLGKTTAQAEDFPGFMANRILIDGLSDTKYRPCPLLVKYVEAGWLGRKTGRGFYDYSVTPAKPTR